MLKEWIHRNEGEGLPTYQNTRPVSFLNVILVSSSQLKFVTTAENVDPAAVVSARREDDEGELPALLQMFEFAPNG